MGARRRPLGPCVVCPQVLGARGRLSYLSTCCLSPGVAGRVWGRHVSGVCVWGRTSQCGYICMTKLYTKILN